MRVALRDAFKRVSASVVVIINIVRKLSSSDFGQFGSVVMCFILMLVCDYFISPNALAILYDDADPRQ